MSDLRSKELIKLLEKSDNIEALSHTITSNPILKDNLFIELYPSEVINKVTEKLRQIAIIGVELTEIMYEASPDREKIMKMFKQI